MKKQTIILFSTTLLLLTTFITQLQAQTILVEDNFITTDQFHDISTLLLWGDSTHPRSCFTLSEISDDNDLLYNAIHLTDEASPLSTYALVVEGKPSLRTASCFDYELESTINRISTKTTIEFDVLWEKYGGTSSYPDRFGEFGRIVIMLLDDYPLGGPRFGDLDSVQMESPFGRPKYNMRIRNGAPVEESHPDYDNYSTTLMLYGGGHDIEGEIEKNAENTTWYPGFSSEAGGGAPGQPASSDYPAVATKKGIKPWYWVSTTEWLHYTWVIEPEELRIYVRPSAEDSNSDSLISVMSIPKDLYGDDYITTMINDVHGSSISSPPPNYNWFETFSAIRVYFRSYNGNITYMANLKIVKDNYTTSVAPLHQEEKQFTVYPNPSSDGQLYFSEPVSQLSVYGITGNQVFNRQNTWLEFVDLSRLNSGIYFYQAQRKNGEFQTGKFIIE